MSRVNEDELLRSLTWSDQNYTLAEIVDKHSLPQVTKVFRGFDGGTDDPSLGHGEVLTLHAVRRTQKLAAEDIKGNKTTIALDCPYKVYVLPPSQDCGLGNCGVEELASIYPTVKYVLVLQAHYGIKIDEDMTNVGEVLEILSIDKRNKKTKVKNVENGHIVTLTSSCTGEFKPLRDYKSYCVKDLKSQFSLPVRAHFFLTEYDANEEIAEELEKLVAKSPDITIVEDIEETLVIATTVSNDADLKFCYEIPKDLEVKVVVTVEYLIGDRHYQEVLTSLDKGFDVVKLLGTQQPEFFKRSDVIKQHKYESIKDLYLNIARAGEIIEEAPPPVLPPRKPKLKFSISDSTCPLQVPIRPPKQFPITCSIDGEKSSTEVNERHNTIVGVPTRPSPPKVAPRPKSCIVKSLPNQPQLPPNKISEEFHYYRNVPDVQCFKSPQSQPETAGNSSRPKVQTEQDGNEQEASCENDSSATSTRPLGPKKLPSNAWTIFPVLPSASKSPLVTIKPSQRVPSQLQPPSKETATTPSPKVLTNSTSPKFSRVAPEKTQGPPVPPSKPLSTPRKTVETAPQITPQYPTSSPMAHEFRSNPLATDSEFIMTNETIPYRSPSELPGDEDDTPPCNTYEEVRPPKNTDDDGFQEESVYVTNTTMMESPRDDNTRESWETEDPYAVVARIPQDLSGLSVTEVGQVLKTLHMECYLSTFEMESIDGDLLKTLGNEELESLNVNPFHRKKLINFIHGWRPKH